MAAITLSRQLGSGGATIAHLVASQLGLHVLGRELVDAVAERAGVPTAVAEALDEQSYGWAGSLIHSLLLAFQGHQMTQESYYYVAAQVIREAATRDNVVILGRAGQVVLGFEPRTFHVHVVAPLDDRAARIAARDGVTEEEALRRIRESDEDRRRYVWAVSRRDWEDPLLYDMVINTHRLDPPMAAGLIVAASRLAGIVA